VIAWGADFLLRGGAFLAVVIPLGKAAVVLGWIRRDVDLVFDCHHWYALLECGFGFLQCFFEPNRRTVHDRIAETLPSRVSSPERGVNTMPLLLRKALVLLAVMAGTLVALGAYLGAFEKVVIEERVTGPFSMVYGEAKGSDAKVVGEITTALQADLERAGIGHIEPCDVFHPDGHSEIGFLVAPRDTAFLASLAPGWQRRVIPAAPSMTVRFPWKSPLSFVVGFMKVDPALRSWRASHGYRAAPAYVIHEEETSLYIQPIARSG
jgi:hypothetical protein